MIAKMRELPQWASDILAATPPRGTGLNRWIFKAAIALRRCGRSDHEIQNTLEAATADQTVRRDEIPRAVERSAKFMSDRPAATPRRTWSTENKPLRRKIIEQADGVEVVDLWERSPYRLLDDGPNTDEIVDLLFPGDPLLCCASTLRTADTAPRSAWRGKLAAMQFIVPSPMSAETGRTQDGRTSPRCLDNTGPRKYLVVEQDDGTADEQAAILLHLAVRAPLALVVTSGNKSLHSWFSCKGATEAQQRKFFDYAVMLGADSATWTPCQLVRMPEGRRDNRKRQALLFLNLEAL
ncbi:MAG: hypothetical protein H8E44_02155 [Planctomycetes bacterium]|nr:hypothetical protein [Planctomycetota bacterium]